MNYDKERNFTFYRIYRCSMGIVFYYHLQSGAITESFNKKFSSYCNIGIHFCVMQ